VAKKKVQSKRGQIVKTPSKLGQKIKSPGFGSRFACGAMMDGWSMHAIYILITIASPRSQAWLATEQFGSLTTFFLINEFSSSPANIRGMARLSSLAFGPTTLFLRVFLHGIEPSHLLTFSI
jgi:hypothetical protein